MASASAETGWETTHEALMPFRMMAVLGTAVLLSACATLPPANATVSCFPNQEAWTEMHDRALSRSNLLWGEADPAKIMAELNSADPPTNWRVPERIFWYSLPGQPMMIIVMVDRGCVVDVTPVPVGTFGLGTAKQPAASLRKWGI